MRFLLSVVIPIAASHSSGSTSCDRAWLEDDAHDDTHNEYVVPHTHEDSECTEEEKVAVEQLAELRRIRELSMQEDASDGSCSTEGSFNTYDRKLPSLLAASPYTCINKGDPSTSPTTSSSAACRIDVWNRKHMQERQKSKLKQDVQDSYDQDNIQVATSKHVTTLPDCNLESDNDGRLKSRSRLLSDIYGDHLNKSSAVLQTIKPSKKRRKAISKIMAAGHEPYVPEAMAGGKDHSTYAST